MKKFVKGVRDVTTRIGGAVESATATAGEIVGSATSVVGDRFQALLPALPFREVRAPVFLVPTGPHPNDYFIIMDLEGVLKMLREGFLPRPVFEIWSGRNDLDRSVLGARLRMHFAEHFATLKEVRKAEVRVAKDLISSDFIKEKMSATERIFNSVEAIVAVLVMMLLTSNPILDALLLTLAVLGAGDVSGRLIGIIMRLLKSWVEQSAQGQEFKELERELKAREADVELAIGHLEIRIHAQLHRCLCSICDVETVLLRTTESEQGPEIRDLVTDKAVLAQLPEEFHVFYTAL